MDEGHVRPKPTVGNDDDGADPNTSKEEALSEDLRSLHMDDWLQIVPQAIINPAVDEVYEFQDVLGEGAFSTVVLGARQPGGERFAIKIIDKMKLDTQLRQQRVLTEINILNQCSHPNIIHLESVHESKLDVCLVLPLMGGGELFDVVAARGQLKESEAARMMRQLLSAIDYLHEAGICHRDLKPENILCTSADPVVADVAITDFGLAKVGADSLATPCGTTQYAGTARDWSGRVL